jgi:hypothetical protein
MRRLFRGRLAIAVGCALATATFTGVALAGSSNGNSENAPGQQKKAEAAQTQAQPEQMQAAAPAQSSATAAPSDDHTAPGQAKKDDAAASSQTQAQAQTQSQSSNPGQSKKAGAAASSDTQAGVKPGSTTTKWTHCRTGGAGTSTATCTAQAGTPATKADVSKRYGNGKTAAQIAVSRGAPNGTLITGPGNSQPHKVAACGKKSNKSGGVDVHAIKSYDASACQPKTATPPAEQTQVTQVCGQKTTVTTSTKVVGVLHGKHEHLMTNPKSAHFTKHDDKKVVATTTETKVEATGENCGSSQTPGNTTTTTTVTTTPVTPVAPVTPGTPAPVAPVTPAPVTPAPVTSGGVNGTTGSQGTSNAAPTNASGVLGANATIKKSKPAGGVLGTVTNVAGSTLPFTGFPVWVALLLALALIAAGLMVWRRGSNSTPTRV